jgi:hypothetical protein
MNKQRQLSAHMKSYSSIAGIVTGGLINAASIVFIKE